LGPFAGPGRARRSAAARGVAARPKGACTLPLQVSVSGVRGVVGDGLDALVVTRWASAFGAWLPPGPVVVGRDTRPSGRSKMAGMGCGDSVNTLLSMPNGRVARQICRIACCSPPGGSGKYVR